MGLSGSLQSFAVPEILQLLSLQQKSGVLRLENGQGQRQILFIERGRIVGTRDRRAEDEDPFLGFLRRTGALTDEQVATVLRVQKETDRDTLYILLSSGLIGRDRLVEAITQHTQQIIDRLLTWNDGSYEFTGDERSIPRMGLKLPLSIEELLMEGMRRLDELATIKQTVLAPDLYLIHADETVDRSSLSRDLLVVYDMVEGSTTVEALVARSPLGEYSTYEAISGLLEAGTLAVDPSPPPPTIEVGPTPLEVAVPIQRKQSVSSTWAGVTGMTLASICLGLALGPILRHHARGLYPQDVEEARAVANEAMARAVYESTTGRTPTSHELIEEGYLRRPAVVEEEAR